MMKPLVPVPRHMAKNKPPHGSPCNNCGLCCYISQCKISVALFGRGAVPCPALIRKNNRYVCGVIDALEERPDATLQATAAKIILGAGRGCDCRINGEPINHSFNYEWNIWEENNWTEIRCAFHLWKLQHDKEES